MFKQMSISNFQEDRMLNPYSVTYIYESTIDSEWSIGGLYPILLINTISNKIL